MSPALKRIDFDEDLDFNLWPVDKAVENIDLIENSEIDAIEDRIELTLLRERLLHPLNPLESLRPRSSVSTGFDVFDDFLLWQGIPKGELTMFTGGISSGAVELWTHSAQKLRAANQKSALVQTIGLQNSIPPRSEIFHVAVANEVGQIMTTLQELIFSRQFELIGCCVPAGTLRAQQLDKLRFLAHQFQIALVFLCPSKTSALYPHFSLVIDCTAEFLTVRKALHRPTPFIVHKEMVPLQLQ